MLFVDGYAGVRSAVRDILVATGIAVHAEAGTLAAGTLRTHLAAAVRDALALPPA